MHFLPSCIFSLIIFTQASLSGLVCSCQNPTAWPNSWTTIPNLSQFLPIEIAWGPLPLFPTNEQQLNKPKKLWRYFSWNYCEIFVFTYPHGLSVKTIQFGWSSVLSTNWTQVKFSQCLIAWNKKEKNCFTYFYRSECSRKIVILQKREENTLTKTILKVVPLTYNNGIIIGP